ncbi:MAG TPA: class I SAM-dependent methyltransferase [Acidimicrobiales bacterium]|nr:class I SAM-dependent methyltransferase [Acidimicrobiales bacterium]
MDAAMPDPAGAPAATKAAKAAKATKATTVARKVAVRTQRRRWQRRTDSWEDHAVAGLEPVIEAVLAESGDSARGVVLDVGAGGGALAVPVASTAQRVIALDVSDRMLDRLAGRAEEEGLHNVEPVNRPIEELDLRPGSLDLIVSNYALHHLLDQDKSRFVHRAAAWLRPGGRLVIGDMMIGRGRSPDDRRILADKARIMMARGPAGWWRIVKNAWRLMTRTVERPMPMESWVRLLEDAGFVDVCGRRVVAEAAVVSGRRR